jgi:hypothetical protein
MVEIEFYPQTLFRLLFLAFIESDPVVGSESPAELYTMDTDPLQFFATPYRIGFLAGVFGHIFVVASSVRLVGRFIFTKAKHHSQTGYADEDDEFIGFHLFPFRLNFIGIDKELFYRSM